MWKDILKNQVAVTGLNMRSMDLDNIIEEEEDDSCRKRIVNFIEKMKAHTRTDDLFIEVIEKINPPAFPDKIPEEVLCYLLEELLYFGDNSGWEKDDDETDVYHFAYRGLTFYAFRTTLSSGKTFLDVFIGYRDSKINIEAFHRNRAFYDFIQKNL